VYRALASPFSNAQQQGASRANNTAALLGQDAAFTADGRPRVMYQQDPTNTTSISLNGNSYNLPAPTGGTTPLSLQALASSLLQTTEQSVAGAKSASDDYAKALKIYVDSILKAQGNDIKQQRADAYAAKSAIDPSAVARDAAYKQSQIDLNKARTAQAQTTTKPKPKAVSIR
jgi:hypothetical protein